MNRKKMDKVVVMAFIGLLAAVLFYVVYDYIMSLLF